MCKVGYRYGGDYVEPLEWSNFPLPLIQVNPPKMSVTNGLISVAYKTGVFSNTAEIQRLASSEMAKHVGGDFHGYLASSNTSALTACLIAVGVRGRHVLISNFTFAATLDAVVLAGGIPIICDISPESLILDKEKIDSILQSKEFDVAAVMPTRVFGFASDISDIVALCNSKKVPVIVDAAASFPGKEDSWNFNLQALYEVFSLHATKVFGIGEGGLIIGSQEAIEKVKRTANFGILLDGSLKFKDGLNSKADEFTAARALARLQEYSVDVEKRYSFVGLYKKIFSTCKTITLIGDNPETIYSYFPVIFESEESLLKFQEVISPFIMSRRYYFPTIQNGYIGDAKICYDKDLGISDSVASRILCLPVYISCTEEVETEISSLVKKALEKLN